jgi:folate-binding protein YgfZ
VFDLEHGLPRLDASQSGQWTPQQLSLDRLKAYSVKKGCYPGQEIVARTHFLGQAKRGLAGFQAPTSVPPGSEVRDGARAVGSMVSCIATDGGCELLAVLPLDQSTQALMAGDTALQPRPLREGLAR